MQPTASPYSSGTLFIPSLAHGQEGAESTGSRSRGIERYHGELAMALIACPECARQVSDKAEACPQCGYPVRAACSRSPAGSTSPGKEGPIAATVLPDDASAIPAIPADSQPTAATHERDVQAVRPATPRLERAAEATSRRTRLRRWIGGALILVFVVAMFGTGILGQNMFTGGLVLLSIGILLFLASYRLVLCSN